ncbi:PREDICTED: LOW QUALITY PROTEIN: uncharacterized protein LOC109482292 [Branchiostoma belcheri]|uniref:receptor protein-tyrosine kinase n=1 Tax=Branchiostoma belcheri TaxID=7741 RepID=A0A6P5AB14_BRABE|nr:PREDICTED: LOW QUALITY PROTEIN: uncharacterized protein LOC109482292 [Branchiostoma belcheri]
MKRSQAPRIVVPENVAVGEVIFNLPRSWSGTEAEEKAELPCVNCKIAGDPDGHFNVTKNCSIVVAKPLDWSVQLWYKLIIYDGVHNIRVEVELTDVEGYPPQEYNEMCETPVNTGPDEFLFRVKWSYEAVVPVDTELQPVGCPDGKYGLLCDRNCTCQNGARCHGFNGACKCPPGWEGAACDVPKRDISITTTPSDPTKIYTSANVTFHCKAYNLDVESVSLTFPNESGISAKREKNLAVTISNIQAQDNGTYTCLLNDTDGNIWNKTLVFKIVNCPPNRKGALCDESCDCQQGGSCDRWAGCICPPGWNPGTRCQTKCPPGTFGKDCGKSCNCLNGAGCNPSDGKCSCTAGWYGKNCSKPCQKGRFGWSCGSVCTCNVMNNTTRTCNNEDGSCTCVPPWTGRNCDKYEVQHNEPLLESLAPVGSVILLVAIVLAVLYKTRLLACSAPDASEEDKILFELKRMEQDLAQSLQPGWLRRWEKKVRHLTPGPLIGEGAFGQVRKAGLRTPEGDLVVAAKTVRVEDSQSYRDFYREAAILVAVHEQNGNPRESNIVQLLGLITKSKEKYILLEYAPKGDLLGFLRRVKNRNGEDLLGELLGFAVHISRALQELERLKIVHRDVAARNVLITADDVAKLADFGLARDVYATTQYVKTNNLGVDEFLPLKWMALESIETGEYTCQSDVWSFGVLLWEIATLGNDPCFDDKIHLSFLQMVGILRRGIRMKRPPGCPEDLYRLMRACWRDVPATRPTPEGIEERLLQLIRNLYPDNQFEMETVKSLQSTCFLQFLCCVASTTFRKSIPENVAVGEVIFNLPPSSSGTEAEEKAELPCSKIAGDPDGHFNVTKNCSIVVAKPLDWSVQLWYKLIIYDGVHNIRVEVELTDVEGYPPQEYNEMCETPVNTGPDEFLFRVKWSYEAVVDTGEVIFSSVTGSKKNSGRWVHSTQPSWICQAGKSDCSLRIVPYITEPNTDQLKSFQGLWQNNIRKLTCTGQQNQPDLSIELFNIKDEDRPSRLDELRKVVPKKFMDNEIYNVFVLIKVDSLFAKEVQSYTCNFPPFEPSVTVRGVGRDLSFKSIEYLDIELQPVGCPDGKYGLLCDRNCTCQNGARCHGFNGACKCPPGWEGAACDVPKRDISFTTTPSDPTKIYTSANVTFHCKAHNLDVESVSLTFPNGSGRSAKREKNLAVTISNIQAKDNGTYTCLVNDTDGNIWNKTLVFKIVNCPPNRKGALCDESCDCQQGGSCDRWAGCICPPGWNPGTRCQTKCPSGTFGKGCGKSCNCLNGAGCNPGDGKCSCTAGWYGKNCSKPCQKGRFGWSCGGVCTCNVMNNATRTCNNEDGSCTCVPPWTGRNCDEYEVQHNEPLLESLVPVGSVLLLVAIVVAILYKTRILACSAPDPSEEDKILFELKRMEQDLAQSLQPGWLRRWEKKVRHLTPGPLIGEGAFGQVRKAGLRTPEGDLVVAAKTVRVEDSQSYRDFYREAAILVAVHEQNGNPRESNIVKLLGLITKSKEKYILLEYAPKGDLLGFLRRLKNRNGEDLLGELLGFAVHISRALQELDRLKIVHRDVAARNVLITADDVAKLADFGLARDVYATTQYVKTNNLGVDEFLPLKWMALESIETGEYTCQSDVWSFGVLLWEIATLGNDPCFDDKIHLTFLQMVGILRRGIRMKRPPGCPEDLYRLMRACWRDVPATRPTPEGIEERLLQLIRNLYPDNQFEMETVL